MGELPHGLDKIKADNPIPEVIEVRPEPQNEVAPDLKEELSPENQGFFSKLGEKSKELAGWAYEKIHRTPIVGKLVGKAEIAFHEHWMNSHNEKAQGISSKITETNNQISQMESSHAEISAALEELRGQNVPNMKSVEEKLRAIEKNKGKLEGTRDNLSMKLDYRNEKMKSRIEKRDAVVDGFIGRCNEKLNPIESEIENLNGRKDQSEFKASMAEVGYRKQLEGLDRQMDAKTKIENALEKLGMSKSEIDKDPSLIKLNTAIIEGKKAIDKDKEKMDKDRKAIDKQINKVGTKAKRFRNKVKEFERMKQGRPAPVEMEPAVVEGGEVVENETEQEVTVEAGSEKKSVKEFIEEFNKFLEVKSGKKNEPEMIDIKTFQEATKGVKELAIDSDIQFKEFKNIIPTYLKVVGIKSKRIGSILETFYKEKINQKI